MNHIIPPQKAILSELEQAKSQEALITVGGCPANSIRKVNVDGSDLFIGAIDISRHLNLGELVLGEDGEYVVDKDEKEEKEKVNKEREVGDSEILWVFGGTGSSLYSSWSVYQSENCRRLRRPSVPWSRNHDRMCQDHPREMGHPTHERALRTCSHLRG